FERPVFVIVFTTHFRISPHHETLQGSPNTARLHERLDPTETDTAHEQYQVAELQVELRAHGLSVDRPFHRMHKQLYILTRTDYRDCVASQLHQQPCLKDVQK